MLAAGMFGGGALRDTMSTTRTGRQNTRRSHHKKQQAEQGGGFVQSGMYSHAHTATVA